LERLGATDDRGFSPFSIDVEPKHGPPDAARDIAFQKNQVAHRGSEDGFGKKLGLEAAA
jgi:hypothetical protein